jgi:hypothetical protein
MELLDPLGLAEVFVQTGMKAQGGGIYANHERLVHLTAEELPSLMRPLEVGAANCRELKSSGPALARCTKLANYVRRRLCYTMR